MQDKLQRGFFGVIIPLNILDSNDLSIAEKFVYAYIASYQKCCMDSNQRIAERLKISPDTVSKSIKKLSETKYIIVEFVNNNSAKRRLYAIFDNPQKIKYLIKKGLFSDTNNRYEVKEIPKGKEISEPQREVKEISEPPKEISEPQNGGEVKEIPYQRIKEQKEEGKTELKPNNTDGLAGNGPAVLVRPERKDFDSTWDFMKACKTFNGGRTSGIENR